MKIDRIGIALAAYQPKTEWFAGQLRSIQAQDYDDWICYVGFDSPMQSVLQDDAIAPFRHDRRFHFFENKKRLGFRDNFLQIAQMLTDQQVDAIAFADQDDIWQANKLFLQREVLQKMPAFALVHSDLYILKDSRRDSRSLWQAEARDISASSVADLMVRNNVTGCSVLMDAALVRQYPDPPKSVTFHDQWFAIIASATGGIYALDQPLVDYRQHDENVIGHNTPALQGGLLANLRGLRTRTVSHWLESYELALALQEAGVPLPARVERMYFSFDFGMNFLIEGVKNLRGNHYLARAYFVRALGKLWSRMYPKPVDPKTMN